jgi:protein tyrosine phosphatase (PTP) superfamily phosphohydrolase (DUF442 family)
MSVADSYNFRPVDDRLTTSGLLTPEQLRALRGEGYDAVINLMPTGENSVADEEAIVREQGLDYVFIPVDFEAPTSADLDAFAAAMDARSDQKVHVHCAANYRVTAFYSLYATQRGLCTPEAASELLQSVWDPAEFPVWSAWMDEERARASS